MEDMITRKEHEEFSKRIDEENHRQNRRIEALEESVKQISELTTTRKEQAVKKKKKMNQLIKFTKKKNKIIKE